MQATLDLRQPRALVALVIFMVVVIGVGALIGVSNTPGAWYEALQKPPFNPPNWVFAPAWFTLYVLIAIAGWRVFMRDALSLPMGLWGVQMLLNWLWSPVWFTAHQPWTAFAIIVALLVTILAFIAMTWRHDRVSALLFVPYAAWVAFATTLNLSIAVLNP